MLPEERARVRIDKQLSEAGWDIVARNEYVPKSAAAVKEALMQGNTESDYLLFVDDKAIAVVEAKREENPLADDVENQAEGYSSHPQGWYGLWFDKQIPLVYLANGNKIYFKNMVKVDCPEIGMDSVLRKIALSQVLLKCFGCPHKKAPPNNIFAKLSHQYYRGNM